MPSCSTWTGRWSTASTNTCWPGTRRPLGILVAAVHLPPYLAVVFTTVLNLVGSMVLVTMQATIYVELRDVKEGVSPKELEAILRAPLELFS